MLFTYLVSEIDISKYKQKEYAKIIKSIYYKIFDKKNKKKVNDLASSLHKYRAKK